jgi:hypothetical protein
MFDVGYYNLASYGLYVYVRSISFEKIVLILHSTYLYLRIVRIF